MKNDWLFGFGCEENVIYLIEFLYIIIIVIYITKDIMKFFIPHSKTASEMEAVYLAIVKHNNALITEKRIFRLTYEHNSMQMFAEVGKPVDGYYKEGNQAVFAIVETETYYCVCLHTRGLSGSDPIYVGKQGYSNRVEYFD